MNIWIDLANSPHVVFFLPIMQELKKQGHTVYVTIRDFSQTVELARKTKIEGITIEKHGGKAAISKIYNLVKRSARLRNFGKRLSIDTSYSLSGTVSCRRPGREER